MGLRKWAITVLAVLVILNIITPCVAWTAGKRLVTIGDMFIGGEFAKWKTTATLFHSQNEAATDTEALAIAFPALDGGTSLAPTIAQTSAGTAAASDTGFFTAAWCFTAVDDPGGYGLTSDIGAWHPMKSSSMVGSGLTWPYMTDAVDTGGSTMSFKPAINTTVDTSNTKLPTNTSSPGKTALTGTNLTPSNTSSTGNTPYVAQRKPSDYKDMKKPAIQNLSGLDKMFRNANRKNTNTQKFYNGTVDRPTTILPMEKPMDIIKLADEKKVINDSRNMTRDGTTLRTLFWDL
jgi:hypothetical protein